MENNWTDGFNDEKNVPRSMRIEDYVGTHACKVIGQKCDKTPLGSQPRVTLYLEVIKSQEGSLPAGAEVTSVVVRSPVATGQSFFYQEVRRRLGLLEQMDPARQDVDWTQLLKQGEGKGPGSRHFGKQVIVHVTPPSKPAPDGKKAFNNVNFLPGPNLRGQ